VSRGRASNQYIQPTAKPTPRLTKRRGNSMTGALTGIRAVISPRQLMTDEMTGLEHRSTFPVLPQHQPQE
jgi:hypothetical protein